MTISLHTEILDLIKAQSGKPTQHTDSDSYLGNSHPRYPISLPVMRKIAKQWMKDHKDLSAREFEALLTSLIKGVSSTEKVMAGILLGYATRDQRSFDPAVFDLWLDHLIGWAEVDSVCTGPYTITHILPQLKTWKALLNKFSRDENINKRRASLVLLTSVVRHESDPQLALIAIKNIDRLKSEKEILITKAISWLLRSLVKHHRALIAKYVKENQAKLPSIAVRETLTVLKTGRKTKTKK